MDVQNGKVSKAAGGKLKVFYSSAEVLALGIPHSDEPPSPVECKFCGETLYFEAVIFCGRVVAWNRKYPQRCTCVQAKEFWEQYDLKMEQKKCNAEIEKKKSRETARIERLISSAGIKKRFASRTFDSYALTSENRKAYETALDYSEHFRDYAAKGKGIYFEGTYGTGKTHLAVAIALDLLMKGIPVICKTSIDMLADIKRSYDANTNYDEYQVLDVYKKADLLVIDDLGKEQCTDWSMPILYTILNDRYEEMRPTIITTNYNEEMLIKRLTPKYGDSSNIEAIISRLHECNDVVTMAWNDYRGGSV